MIKYLNFFILNLLFATNLWADDIPSINSATIIADTMAGFPSCAHYKIEGMCFWEDEYGIVTETLYIDQYLPDVIVSVFNKPGENPWLEPNATLDQAGKVAEDQIVQTASGGMNAGYGQHSMSNIHEQSVYFKEADVIGNPALSLLEHDIFLASTATPMMPYFQSMLDSLLWRGMTLAALPEKIAAMPEDIVRRVGAFPINWGGVFPIEGKVNASNDSKAAAVIAQRSVNLLSSTPLEHMPLHVYQGLSNICGEHCTADRFHENDEHTQFQRIYPNPQTTCEVFGKTAGYGNGLYKQTNGAYAWIVWRHYHGCVQGDGKYIGHT